MPDGFSVTTSSRIADIVRSRLMKKGYDGPVGYERDLHELGLASLDMVNLMLAVEAEFDLEIPQQYMTPAHFRSVAAIEALVIRLTG